MGRFSAYYDIVTVVFLMATVGIVSATLLIVNDPSVPFNPFPLAEVPTIYVIPSGTPTPTNLPTATHTATALPSATPTATNTATPSATPTVTPTLVIPNAQPINPVNSPLPSPTIDLNQPITGDGVNPQQGVILATPTSAPQSPSTANAVFPFDAQIRYERNANSQGCQWSSIAGTATGLANEPIVDLAVEINGNDIEAVVFTGSAPDFGFAGFEFPLGSVPARGVYRVRLVDQSGFPISDFVTVTTGETCDRNVAIVDFVQIQPLNR